MAAPNSAVSVFHFTSRISSAKIRKYKLATERGMNGGNLTAPTTPPISIEDTVSPAATSSNMEPPAKRPKLKLSVRPPSASPDTIAVSRPRRENALRIRYSENMIIDAADVDDMDMDIDEKPKPSPAPSSDLSSRKSANPIEKEPPPVQAPDQPPARKGDYGRDFMSYYVTGGEEEEEEKPEESQPEAAPRRLPEAPKQAPAPPMPDKPPMPTQFEHHVQPPSYPKPRLQPPRPSFAQPTVHLIDTTRKSVKATEPDTVARMIKKLESLSAALASFSGVPSRQKSPREERETGPVQQPTSEKKDVDNFLAMFDDADEDDEDSESKDDQSEKTIDPLDQPLRGSGEPDGALTYGIQFIQNALRSWAQQRLSTSYTQHYMAYQQHARDAAQPQKRGPGRPRKFELGDEDYHSIPPPPLNIQFDLAKTAEGAAIAAFQEVLDSGCLQVNALLPLPLTRALRHLYVQIDRLINQGSRVEPPWQCMSYRAQIAAQKVRVESWKDAHARAQEEMARQQYLAQQHMMQQMGLNMPNHRGQMTEHAQAQHAIALERKRSLQHAAQQPHLSKYLTNPLNLEGSGGSGHAGNPSANQASPVVTSANGTPNRPSQSSPGDGRGNYVDAMNVYAPSGFLPRSGQSMKFSFAPTSELALKTFGVQAFPADYLGPNLPNRGPMITNPHMSNNHAHMRNGSQSTPMAASVEPNGNVSGGIQDDTRAYQSAQSPNFRGNPRLSDAAGEHGGESEGVGMAARFPHPGAIVIDQ